MQFQETLKSKKSWIIAAASVVVSCALLLSAFTGSQGGQGDSETLYRESVVTRGDLTVGITETATATLKTHSLSFDIGAEIEQVYVKAGQSVKEGDPIAVISSDSIYEEISSLQVEYQEAALKLSEAELSKQKGELEAVSSYNSTVNKSGSADSTYDMTVEKLQQAVTKAEKEIEDIQTEIRTYTTMLRSIDSYDVYYGNYTSSWQWYEYAQEWVASCLELMSEYRAEMGEAFDAGSAEYQRLLANYNSALEELDYARLEYEDAASEYNSVYDSSLTDADSIKKARTEARERLVDAEAALREAQYNLEVQTSEADLTREDTYARAELAETTYDLELKSLENSVTSKKTAVQNIQEQIDRYTGYLQKTVLTAPCDGVVTSVSHDAGDEVQAGAAVATISDSQYVYVYIAVTQDDITGITLGQSCEVTMDAFEEIAFDGTIDSITTTPVRSASGSASYTVTIRLEGDTAQVYEGMTGSATLITRQQKDVLYVTNRTVYEHDGQSYVKVKREDDTIEEVAVATGFSDGRNVEITEGLEEGMTVIMESQVSAS